jgi:hypothetical protein
MLLLMGILSAVFFVGSLIAIPILLVRLPVDYFDERQPRIWLKGYPAVIRVTAFVIKNLVGVVFVFAGIAMLVLPGQGILTMLIGLSIVDFPGKKRLERSLLGRPAVLNGINAVRAKFGKPPLVIR